MESNGQVRVIRSLYSRISLLLYVWKVWRTSRSFSSTMARLLLLFLLFLLLLYDRNGSMWSCCLSQCIGFFTTLGSSNGWCWLWFAFACQQFPVIALLGAIVSIFHFVHQWHDVIIYVNNFNQVLRPFARQWSLFQNARSSCHSNIITNIELRCCVLCCHVGWFCFIHVQDIVVVVVKPNVIGCISDVSVLHCIMSTNCTIDQIKPYTFLLIDWIEWTIDRWILYENGIMHVLSLPKTLMTCTDNNRWICDNNIHILAFGHYK